MSQTPLARKRTKPMVNLNAASRRRKDIAGTVICADVKTLEIETSLNSERNVVCSVGGSIVDKVNVNHPEETTSGEGVDSTDVPCKIKSNILEEESGVNLLACASESASEQLHQNSENVSSELLNECEKGGSVCVTNKLGTSSGISDSDKPDGNDDNLQPAFQKQERKVLNRFSRRNFAPNLERERRVNDTNQKASSVNESKGLSDSSSSDLTSLNQEKEKEICHNNAEKVIADGKGLRRKFTPNLGRERKINDPNPKTPSVNQSKGQSNCSSPDLMSLNYEKENEVCNQNSGKVIADDKVLRRKFTPNLGREQKINDTNSKTPPVNESRGQNDSSNPDLISLNQEKENEVCSQNSQKVIADGNCPENDICNLGENAVESDVDPERNSEKRNSDHIDSEKDGIENYRNARKDLETECDSADESRFSVTSTVSSQLDNTDSACVSDDDQSTVAEDDFIKPKRKRRVDPSKIRLHEAKCEFISKYKDKTPDRSSMRMLDLIYYNPSSNPMKSTQQQPKETVASSLPPEQESEQLAEENVDDPDEEEEEEVEVPGPRVKVGPDGEIVIDEQSLVIETTLSKKSKKRMANLTVVVDTGSSTTYTTYSKKKRPSGTWSSKETMMFYKALQTVGTDFSLMQILFPNRTRVDLKIKYKKEEKINRDLVVKALSNPVTFDLSALEKEFEEAAIAEALPKKRGGNRKRKGRNSDLGFNEEDVGLVRNNNRKRKVVDGFPKRKRVRKKKSRVRRHEEPRKLRERKRAKQYDGFDYFFETSEEEEDEEDDEDDSDDDVELIEDEKEQEDHHGRGELTESEKRKQRQRRRKELEEKLRFMAKATSGTQESSKKSSESKCRKRSSESKNRKKSSESKSRKKSSESKSSKKSSESKRSKKSLKSKISEKSLESESCKKSTVSEGSMNNIEPERSKESTESDNPTVSGSISGIVPYTGGQVSERQEEFAGNILYEGQLSETENMDFGDAPPGSIVLITTHSPDEPGGEICKIFMVPDRATVDDNNGSEVVNLPILGQCESVHVNVEDTGSS